MAQSYFPLRWESTGDQWWYVSPIDWAAANGHYDLVRELLYLDTNLLIKLTSLRRLRRLETVWDDDSRFENAAKCRSFVARNLLLECETKNHKNTLLRAGYGGWLLYTAASAGDVAFVKELLGREPLLVFGEGEYGVTDIFYAAARSKNSEVFRLVFEYAVKPRGLVEAERGENAEIFRWEMVNRAVHATARGGNLEMMREILGSDCDCSDVLSYRDVQGSTILHAASGRGQVEVVKYIVSSFNIIDSRDNEGNIALNIAAYRGHLSVVEALIIMSPSSSYLTNNAGDTFLHMAVAGFRTPGFRRLDRQMELMKHLVNGKIVNIQEIINIRNYAGRTALHVAMIGNMHSNLVELLMTARSIDLNIRDVNGMTPLDLLGQRPRSTSSEILIKQLVSAGGVFSSRDHSSISAIASQLKMQTIGSSPGTNFKISDAEIFLHTGIEIPEASGRPSSCSSSAKSETAHFREISSKKNYANRAANKLKILLRWPRRKEKKKLVDDEDSMDSLKKWSEREETPTPLRQRFSKPTSLLNNKRTLSVRSSMPSPATKKKFAAGLRQGVIQAMPHLAPPPLPSGRSSSSDMYSRSGISTPMSFEKQNEITGMDEEVGDTSCSNAVVNGRSRKSGGLNSNSKAMNQFFCFGAQGLTVEDPVSGRRSKRLFKRSALSVA